MTQKEFYQNLKGWEDVADPEKLCQRLRETGAMADFKEPITVEECETYLNEKYPVTDGIDQWLRKYRSKK